MKRATILLLVLPAMVFAVSLRGHARGDGKAVFMTNCQSCHSVTAEGIPAREVPAMNIDWTRLCRECTPDLSDVGARRKADWLRAYLKNDKKGRNGLKHNEVPLTVNRKALIAKRTDGGGPLGGTLNEDELETLVQWLTTLRKASAQAPAGTTLETTPTQVAKSAPVALSAQDAAAVLLAAKTVGVIGQAGRRMMDRAMWNPNGERAREKVEAVITAAGRYTIVPRLEDADLVVVVLEYQKNINLLRRANLVAQMKVYRGGQEPTPDTPTLWSGEASEGFSQPATKVAEKFRDFVNGLQPRKP